MKIVKYGLMTINIILLTMIMIVNLCNERFSNDVLQRVGYRKNSVNKEEKVFVERINSNIIKNTVKHIYSDNEYEEEILNRDDDKLYKLKHFEIDGTDGYMIFIYDPSKIKLMTCKGFNTINNSGKERVTTMVKRYGAVVGTNGGGFFDDGNISTDVPIGYIIKDGEIVWDYQNGRKGLIIGFNNDNKLIMLENVTGKEALEQGMRDGLEFGPVLIRDGEVTKEVKKERWARRASRLIIAQREDGIVIFVATNGGSYEGITMKQILEELQKYNVVNAANLDGGASTQLVVEGKLLTNVNNMYGNPVRNGRTVVNGWGLIP